MVALPLRPTFSVNRRWGHVADTMGNCGSAQATCKCFAKGADAIKTYFTMENIVKPMEIQYKPLIAILNSKRNSNLPGALRALSSETLPRASI